MDGIYLVLLVYKYLLLHSGIWAVRSAFTLDIYLYGSVFEYNMIYGSEHTFWIWNIYRSHYLSWCFLFQLHKTWPWSTHLRFLQHWQKVEIYLVIIIITSPSHSYTSLWLAQVVLAFCQLSFETFMWFCWTTIVQWTCCNHFAI